MTRALRCAVMAALVAGAMACDVKPTSAPASCPPVRATKAGTCCPAWTTAGARDACVAHTWTLPTRSSDALGDPGARTVMAAVDARGRALVAFEAPSGPELLEESAPGAWGLRHPGAALGGGALGDLVAGPDGTVKLAMFLGDGSGSGMFLSERDAGGTWKDPASLGESFSFPGGATQPRFATNRKGEWLLAWNQWTSAPGFGVALARRASPGEPWQRPASADDVLSQPIFYTNSPVPVLNDAGAALITWYQSLGGPLLALASGRPGPGGAFTHPKTEDALSLPGGTVNYDGSANVRPVLAPDGTAVVAWLQENEREAMAVYLATRDAAGRWLEPKSLDDAFSRPAARARFLQLARGRGGDVYVVWCQSDERKGGDAVYAARRRPDGTWAEDGRHAVQISSPGAQGLFPVLAVGPEGGVVMAWQERTGNEPWRVAARRTGGALEPWGPIERLSPATGEDAFQPAAAVGPSDSAVVAWTQGPLPAQHILVARLQPSGR